MSAWGPLGALSGADERLRAAPAAVDARLFPRWAWLHLRRASLRQSAGLVLAQRLLSGHLIGRRTDARPGGPEAAWCAYARISWRTKVVWGLMGYGFVQENLRQGGLQVRPDGELYAIQRAGDPAPLYAARHLDCLMLGNDREIVQRSIGMIEQFEGSILGVVLNRKKYYIPDFIYQRV